MNRRWYFLVVLLILSIGYIINSISYKYLEYRYIGSIIQSILFFIAYIYRMKDTAIKKYVYSTGIIMFILSIPFSFLLWFFIISGFIYKSNNYIKDNNKELKISNNKIEIKKVFALLLGVFIILMYVYGAYKLLADKDYSAKQLIIGILLPPYTAYIGINELFKEEKVHKAEPKVDPELKQINNWIKDSFSEYK